MSRFDSTHETQLLQALDQAFLALTGSHVVRVDPLDGVRATFQNGEILHLRPSGNAPEFRAYAEASSPERATELCRGLLAMLPTLAVG